MAAVSSSPPRAADVVDAVRGFNRFYTRQIGLLGEHVFESPFSLSEVRVLYELAHRDGPTATDLGRDLGLDAGYLSRMLRRFETRRLITRTSSPTDARQSHLRLTPRGRSAFAPLETRARSEISSMLARLSTAQRQQVVGAMSIIEQALSAETREREPYILRPHQPGDMGWVVQQHGAIYAREWGYNQDFEALVARIAADFLEHFDPARERCWMAEKDGANVGSVFLVSKSKTVAKLRMLIVDPNARGLGIGHRLVDECVRFARIAGYRTITLWTHSQLAAARRIYQDAGFTLTHHEKTHSFGKDLVDETWDLQLR
jgi:DNA-binding MarR family transcriptional regulator/N-acetylglutamate synthase-like GNAT family acetyltransferase